jgi:methylated-DNA-[protein]-cysteine S-methyltransferase
MNRNSDRENAADVLHLQTPIGWLRLRGGPSGVAAIEFFDSPAAADSPTPAACLCDCRGQLEEYFGGRRRQFDLPLDPVGTPFQLRVWEALRAIPCGQTAAYGEIARAVNRPRAFRAVGQANHVNPLTIVVPCHRVVGADGSLTGYGGGLWRKQWLLDLERRMCGS